MYGLEAATGAAIGAATAKWQDERQIKQQKKLQSMQIEGNKEMGKFNKELAIEMWKDTNYQAQRKEMEKAGINPGLMYGMGGGGGVTANVPTGNVSGGNAAAGSGELGMGIQLGLQAEMMQAQIQLAESQAEKNKVEADKLKGIDTEEGISRKNLNNQNLINAGLQEDILKHDKGIKEIEENIASRTQEDLIKRVWIENAELLGKAEKAQNEGKMSTDTYEAEKKVRNLEATEKSMRIALMKADIIKKGAETDAQRKTIEYMAAQINNMSVKQMQDWEGLSQNDKERWIREQQLELNKRGVEFNTSTANQIRQWTGIVTDIIGAAKGTSAMPIYQIR